MMKIQAAIDRVDLDKAVSLTKQISQYVDIIEWGTSLVKDFGIQRLAERTNVFGNAQVLYDIKTIDEGEYEFKVGFESKADILTVMGASSVATLEKCYQVAQDQDKTMMIDLMGLDESQIEKVLGFDQAIYCIHHSKDSGKITNASDTVASFRTSFPSVKHIAIAGGIDYANTVALAQQGIVDIAIVGSGIVKAIDPVAEAKRFGKVVSDEK
ncbi:orotidine 5'-phosphate decarboxylase / HUMPS family protein [Levilactobacillus andaensis]|uniref:orotidine 5'-phosphate decarboxylase / HUMPS family protein n=1 Tax=Levilactobacillus andaensis TaxID=2799570 RepID=UPI001F2DFC92|nr:orotidine 5'-phosphate decarboxylase / HUMPS family protein [Levilactobacillus andaensis]